MSADLPEAMELLAYAREQDLRDRVWQRWLASGYSASYSTEYEEFLRQCTGSVLAGIGKPESADEIMNKIDNIMDGW